MSETQSLPEAAPRPAPGTCLHCEEAAAVSRFGLCERCRSIRGVRKLYIRRRGWTPEFEAHLLRLRRRAEQQLPLFDGPLVVGRPRDGSIHPLHVALDAGGR